MCSTIVVVLGGEQETVLVHWACTKIIGSSDVPDAVLLEVLLEKVEFFYKLGPWLYSL